MSETRGAQQATFAWTAADGADANGTGQPDAPAPMNGPATAEVESTTVVERPPRSPRRRRQPQPPHTTLAHDDRWLTPDEAFVHLGLPTRKALYAAVARGQVPVHRWNTRLRFARSELDALLGRGR